MNRYIRMLAATAALLALAMEARAADVPFITGGAGVEEREELLARERDYNLKIVVANNAGDYLADVKVRIESAKGGRLLRTNMEGPILLAKLPPGTYTVRATSVDETITRTVTVPAQGMRQLDLRWAVVPDELQGGGPTAILPAANQNGESRGQQKP